MHYLKFLFFGPPRTGKTTARRRLVKEIVNIGGPEKENQSASTLGANNNDAFIRKIKKVTSEAVAIFPSEWWSLRKSKEGERHDTSEYNQRLTKLISRYISICKSEKSTVSNPRPDSESLSKPISNISESETEKTLDADVVDVVELKTELMSSELQQTTQIPFTTELQPESSKQLVMDSKQEEIDRAAEELESIIKSGSSEDLRKVIEDLIMLNMIDIGGQPAFLELFPAFTIGPALYLIFFRLDKKLNENQVIIFQAADGEEMKLESNYCTETVIHQILSSIACFGSQERTKSGEPASSTKVCSRALLFGTYKDVIEDNDKRIKDIDTALRLQLLPTKFYQEKMLQKTSDGKMFYSLNNMKGNDSEMLPIRKHLEKMIEDSFTKLDIPASWLMFRIALQNLHKPVVTLTDCEKIAKRVEMKTPVQDAIWFFHHNVGNLMHYSNIDTISDRVICDPQVVFDCTSELIIDTFKTPDADKYKFYNEGRFSLKLIKERTEHHRKDKLSPTQLVDLLKNHNIIAEIKSDGECSETKEPTFIMPGVLKEASEEELKLVSSEMSTQEVAPLMIHFESGFVPFGVFCASIAYLIAHQNNFLPQWELCYEKEENKERMNEVEKLKVVMMKNKVTFSIGNSLATLISRPQYLEILVKRRTHATKKYSPGYICSTVRQKVVESLETVINNMRKNSHSTMVTPLFPTDHMFVSAFPCKLEYHSDHFMKVDKVKSTYSCKCLNEGTEIDITEEQLVWFTQVSFMHPTTLVHS